MYKSEDKKSGGRNNEKRETDIESEARKTISSHKILRRLANRGGGVTAKERQSQTTQRYETAKYPKYASDIRKQKKANNHVLRVTRSK